MSSSSDEDRSLPLASDGAAAALRLRERLYSQARRRKRSATLAARKALAFLEEAALRYHEHGDGEDDAPAFVDAQSLRVLAAGDDDWKYISRKERKAAKVRTEAAIIANQTEVASTHCPQDVMNFDLLILGIAWRFSAAMGDTCMLNTWRLPDSGFCTYGGRQHACLAVSTPWRASHSLGNS
jgi:hypothetical protein